MERESQVVYSDAECLHCSAPIVFLKTESGEVVLFCEECQGVYLEPDAVDMDIRPPRLGADGVVAGTQLHVQTQAFAQPDDLAGTAWAKAQMIGDQITLAEYEEYAEEF